jgi:DNA-binding GntR family transcriptional regulator
VLAQTVRAASEHELESLALEEDEPVFHLRRVFLADDTPAILADNAIPLALLQQPAELCDGQLAHQRVHRALLPDPDRLRHLRHRRRAARTAPTQALLRLEDHSPLLRLRQVFYDRQNEPLLCGSSSYNEKLLGLRLVQSWS